MQRLNRRIFFLKCPKPSAFRWTLDGRPEPAADRLVHRREHESRVYHLENGSLCPMDRRKRPLAHLPGLSSESPTDPAAFQAVLGPQTYRRLEPLADERLACRQES